MSTESEGRARTYNPIGRLAMAAVDILTGVTEASVLRTQTLEDHSRLRWTLQIKKTGVQDD